MRRRKFSEREVLATLQAQGVLLFCYRCKATLVPCMAQREHITELALGGKDEPENCAYSHTVCHTVITNGTKATTAGSSKQRIAKVRRLRGETKPKRKRKWPKSRPMQSRLWAGSPRKLRQRPEAPA